MQEDEFERIKRELESIDIESFEEKGEAKEGFEEKGEAGSEEEDQMVYEVEKPVKRKVKRKKKDEKEENRGVEEKKERIEEKKDIYADEDLEGVITEEELVEKALEFVINELSEFGVKESVLRRITKVLRMDNSRQWLISPTHFAWIVKQYLPRLPEIELGSIANTLYLKFGHELIRMRQQSMQSMYAIGQIPYSTYTFNPLQYAPPHSPHTTHAMLYPPQNPSPNPMLHGLTPHTHTPLPPHMGERERRKTYTVVIDGQTITTDDYREYLALKEWIEEREAKEEERQRRREEHELRMKKLEEELRKTVASEEKTVKKTDDTMLLSLQSQISNIMNVVNELRKGLEEEIKRREEERIKVLEEKAKRLDDIIRNPFDLVGHWEETLRRMGYTRSGRSAYDLIDNLRQDIQTTINAVLSRIPAPAQEYSRGIYSKKERDKRISKVEGLIEEGLKRASVERDILELSKDVYAGNTRTTDAKEKP